MEPVGHFNHRFALHRKPVNLICCAVMVQLAGIVMIGDWAFSMNQINLSRESRFSRQSRIRMSFSAAC
jgi:hypothetical protein